MSCVGFGGYRISIKSSEHYESLKKAIELGCKYIDTSSNYTDGDSERLIGKVLKEVSQRPVVISKAGYIQGSNLDELTPETSCELVNLSESLKHSIHPSFLNKQLEKSLERLDLKTIDIYLLHNPEYYLKLEDSTKEEYYRRIEFAFQFLEEKVKEGKIKSYGISSNTFVDPREDHESTDLERVWEIAQKIPNHHFKYIQFPLNLLELGALERQFEGDHLIEKAQSLGLKTIINRPLNAFTENSLLRLANYKTDESITSETADKLFHLYMTPLSDKWEENKEEGDESLFEVSFIKQFSNIWNKQNSIDAVEQIFYQYFFPFVSQTWGKNLTAEESEPFYNLFELAVELARKNMNIRANKFKEQAINKGLLFESSKDLSQMAVEKYQTFGVDIILVGMKKPQYVEKLKEYF